MIYDMVNITDIAQSILCKECVFIPSLSDLHTS